MDESWVGCAHAIHCTILTYTLTTNKQTNKQKQRNVGTTNAEKRPHSFMVVRRHAESLVLAAANEAEKTAWIHALAVPYRSTLLVVDCAYGSIGFWSNEFMDMCACVRV